MKGFCAAKGVKSLSVGLLALVVLFGFTRAVFHAAQPPQVIRVPDPQQGLLTIQKAINAIAVGGTILIAPGLYDENLIIGKSLTLRGEGAGSDKVRIIGVASDSPVVRIESTETIEVAIENLTLAESKRSSGIVARGKAKITTKDVQISNNGADGLHVNGSASMSLTNTQLSNNADDGLEVSDSATVSFNSCQVSGNSFGLYVHGSAVVNLTNCQISGNKDTGISAGDSTQVSLTNSPVSGNNSGLSVRGSAKLNVQGSLISNNKGSGIFLANKVVAEIRGNRIIGNQGYGVVAYWMGCVDGYDVSGKFDGQVTGGGNTIPKKEEPEGNQKGDLCPSWLDFLKKP